MSTIASQINPQVLKWARERAGLSTLDVSIRMNKDASVIDAWEKGTKFPTYVQLEKLAYNIFKRPIAIFFFPEPPMEEDFKESFRTLPEFEFDKLSSDTKLAIREAKSMQVSLLELSSGVNPSQSQVFKEIKPDSFSISKMAKSVRNNLGLTLSEQIKLKSPIEAFKKWRETLQDKGVFIFKRSFKQKDISGFCLHHDEFPIIYINNSTSPNRQIFTIFHELAHILFGYDGITFRDDSYINSLDETEKTLEINSNKFAAEFLVPSNDFQTKISNQTITEKLIQEVASYYVVSREVILRKLLQMNKVNNYYYASMSNKWNKEFLESRKSSSTGGNYYATQATYLGEKYLQLAFSKYYRGSLSKKELADHLNMKAKNVMNIESYVLTSTSTE